MKGGKKNKTIRSVSSLKQKTKTKIKQNKTKSRTPHTKQNKKERKNKKKKKKRKSEVRFSSSVHKLQLPTWSLTEWPESRGRKNTPPFQGRWIVFLAT